MARYAVNLPNGKTDETGIFRLLGRLFTQSGVVESTALTVTAQFSPDMSVRVSGSANSDNAVFITSTGACYLGWNSTSEVVTIPSNATGVAKTDTLVAYIDTAAGSATSNNPNGLVFTSVRGSGTSTPPTDAEINTDTGSKPWIRLANIAVANGATSINSGNITDVRSYARLESDYFDTNAAWTTYTPTWTASSGTPSIGSGTLAGVYYKMGRLVTATWWFQAGSDTTYGTGDWIFSAPVTPKTMNTFERNCGTFSGEDQGVKGYAGLVALAATNAAAAYANKFVLKVHGITAQGESFNVNPTRPFTWGSGDFFFATATYEAAT